MKGGLGFARTTIDVPPDAHALDLVFRDAAGAAGFVDDNGGLDYHVPVEGAAGPAPALRVVHVAVEMAPIAKVCVQRGGGRELGFARCVLLACDCQLPLWVQNKHLTNPPPTPHHHHPPSPLTHKVGGMGDVVTALGRAVQEEGHSVEVIVPKYDVINYSLVEGMAEDGSFFWEGSNVKVWRGRVEGLNSTFLEPDNGHFWRGCIYGRGDDHVRFGYFCGAALEYLKVRNVGADVVHCHDWQSAPVAWGNRGGARCVFTIHNLNYGADLVGRAMAACDVATTVSPTYAREVCGCLRAVGV
jgi:starch synthase